MASFYRKGRKADQVAGAAVFAAGIASGFASLGLTSAQQLAFNALNTSLQAAWLTSIDPATRTPVTIGQRDEKLAAMKKMAMDLAKIIYAQPAVTDSQLTALELAPRPGHTPSQLIGVVPQLTVVKVQGRQVLIRVRGTARGKLPAAIGAMLFSYVGEAPPASAEDWISEGPITKDSALIAFAEGAVAVGGRVWFTAQWFNTKGVGPGCPPVLAIINADASMAA